MLEAILGKVTYGKLLTAKIVRIGGDYENELAAASGLITT
jgi:hypothetical protein